MDKNSEEWFKKQKIASKYQNVITKRDKKRRNPDPKSSLSVSLHFTVQKYWSTYFSAKLNGSYTDQELVQNAKTQIRRFLRNIEPYTLDNQQFVASSGRACVFATEKLKFEGKVQFEEKSQFE